MRRWSIAFICLLMISSILGGCTTNEEAGRKQQKNLTIGTTYPKTVKDAVGNDVIIEKKPTRIVSLMPSNTEIVYALGKGGNVIGVTDWDNYPEEVVSVEKIGGLDYDVEKVLSLEPDLILAHTSSMSGAPDRVQSFQNTGIPVVVVNNADAFADVYESIALIGQAVGAESEATELINAMKNDLEQIQEKARVIAEKDMKTVWVEVSPQPDLFATGKGTFIDEMLTMIHAKNAASDQKGWVHYTEEAAILLNPDVIIVTYGHYIENPTEQVYARQAWQDVTAVVNKNVFEVHPDMVTRSGPRLIQGVEQLASVIYPEVFK